MPFSQRPTQRLVEQLFSTPRIEELDKLQAFLDRGGNVFDLVALRHADICRDFELDRQEADLLLKRSYSMARYLAREFREQRLTRPSAAGRSRRTGVQALVEGPNFANLFRPDLGMSSPAGAIESSVSPVAYLMSLISWVRLYIEPCADDKKILLFERRPDLLRLMIDEAAVNRVQPTISILSQVLFSYIETNKVDPMDVETLMTVGRYPNNLPHYHAWQSIEYAIQAKGHLHSLGDVTRMGDLQYPYFKESGARGRRSDDALRFSCGLALEQQALLKESGPFIAPHTMMEPDSVPSWIDLRTGLRMPSSDNEVAQFYRDNFGCEGYEDLLVLDSFCRATQLNQTGVEELFSIGAFAPQRSANAPVVESFASAADAGSVFINAGVKPAVDVERVALNETFEFRLKNLNEGNQRRFVRINQKIRLDKWLNLPSYEVDQLITAFINAQNRVGKSISNNINDETLRALGLFQELRTVYGCSAEDMAAFIDLISVHGRGEQLSHFDRIFNAKSLFERPLKIDNVAFAAIPVSEEDYRTADHICLALGIDFDTYRRLALLIAVAHGAAEPEPEPDPDPDPDPKPEQMLMLHRNLSVFSSFYRLVRLPRILGVSPMEGVALLLSLDMENDGWLAQLAGPTKLTAYRFSPQADLLSVIHAALSAVQWCQRNNLTIKWLVQHVSPVVIPVVASDAELDLLDQISVLLQPVLMTEALILDAGVPADFGHGGWMTLLAELVDVQGLIVGRTDESESSYLARAREEIAQALHTAGIEASAREWVAEAILTVLLRSRAGQRVVVQESFAVYLDLGADLVPPVVEWSGGSIYQLLSQALKAVPEIEVPEEPEAGKPAAEPVDPDLPEQREFLRLLVELRRRSEVARELKLSSPMLMSYLEGGQSTWFGVEDRSELSLKTIFYLTLYDRAVKLAKQPAQKLLEYLKMANQVSDDLSEDALSLVRDAAAGRLAEFFGCGIRDVLDCADHASLPVEGERPGPPLIKNLPQLALLLRLLEGREQTGLDFNALLTLARLDLAAQLPHFRAAAQRAMESLSETTVAGNVEEEGEYGQSVNVQCELDHSRLVANAQGELATFTLTLRGFTGQLLKYVTVHWSHKGAGVLKDYRTTTDRNGVTVARLEAGTTQGTAYVYYRLDMRDEEHAGTVTIGCGDRLTQLDKKIEPRRDLLAGEKEFATLSVQFIDEYTNWPVGEKIDWSTDLGSVRPAQSFIDIEGWATIRLYSQKPGTAIVRALYAPSGEGVQFGGVTFVDQPRIEALFNESPAVVGRSLDLVCAVVGLDGLPSADVTVHWVVNDEEAQTSVSNKSGRALLSVSMEQAGEWVVTASTGTAGQSQTLRLRVAEQVLVTDYSRHHQIPVAGGRDPSMLWIELKDALVEGHAIAHFPVTWSAESLPTHTPVAEPMEIKSDELGRSTFPFKVSLPGEYQVTAHVVDGVPDRIFNFDVRPAFQWEVTLDTVPASTPVTVLPGNGRLELERNKTYQLSIRPVEEVLDGSNAVMSWRASHSTPVMGMTFEPKLAREELFTDNLIKWLITCGDIRDGEFQLVLLAERVAEALILPGTLRKPPPPPSSAKA